MAMDVDKKYQVKDEIDHILSRTGMWLGSMITESINTPIYFPSKNMLVMKQVPYNAGLCKIIDEVFSNSVDEYRRSKQAKKDSLFDITRIILTVNRDGYVEVFDNGGIPVVKHKETNLYVPHMIFGMLRTSSNYDDTQQREVVGTNGLGAKLTNIFSRDFKVETADGKFKYSCTWTNNMHDCKEEPVIKSKEHYTKISFHIDLERFDSDMSDSKRQDIDLGTIRMLQKRCIDTAASNCGLVVEFRSDVCNDEGEKILNSEWKFSDFKEYIELFVDRTVDSDGNVVPTIDISSIMEWHKAKDSVYILFNNRGSSLNNVGFVNGVICSEGTHINKVCKQIVDAMLLLCKKNNMDVITEKDIMSCFSVFVNCTIYNPNYDSQAKTRLSTKIENSQLLFDDKFLKSLRGSTLFQILKDYYDIKYKEVKKRELRKLNNTIKQTKIKKLIQPGIVDQSRNELFIFEGDSASSGFRKCRNVYQAAYLLRGKIKNTLNITREEILENQELRELLAILKLNFGDPKGNLKNCSMNRIIFCTDMDYDGHHICGLLITFFKKHFPELFYTGKIFRALSPIVIAEKGKDIKYFYSMKEYEEAQESLKGYDFRYTKGLGGLEVRDYQEMLNNQKLVQYYADKETDETIAVWFDKQTDIRKDILMSENSEE